MPSSTEHLWHDEPMSEKAEFPRVELALCDSAFVAEPISPGEAERTAPLLAALGHPARLRLMSMIAAHVSREACVCDLDGVFGLDQDAIEVHLRTLVEAGLVERVQRGVWGFYKVRSGVLSDLVGVTAGMTR
jgi:ArsR family transcriptional regulator